MIFGNNIKEQNDINLQSLIILYRICTNSSYVQRVFSSQRLLKYWARTPIMEVSQPIRVKQPTFSSIFTTKANCRIYKPTRTCVYINLLQIYRPHIRSKYTSSNQMQCGAKRFNLYDQDPIAIRGRRFRYPFM